MGYNPSLKNTFMAVMIGYLANLALPRLGEVTRCGILARYEKIPIQKSFGTVVTERAIDLITLSIAFVVTFIIHFDKLAVFKDSKLYMNISSKYAQLENPGVIYYITGGIFLFIIIVLYTFRRRISQNKIYQKIKEIFMGFIEGLKSLVKIKNPILFIFHSINIWIMYLLMTWVIFLCLPETENLGIDVGLAVLVIGSIGIILVQGGIGIYPWLVAETLVIFMVPEIKGYATGWLSWTGQTLMVVIFGLLAMGLLPILNTKKNELPPTQQAENN